MPILKMSPIVDTQVEKCHFIQPVVQRAAERSCMGDVKPQLENVMQVLLSPMLIPTVEIKRYSCSAN